MKKNIFIYIFVFYILLILAIRKYYFSNKFFPIILIDINIVMLHMHILVGLTNLIIFYILNYYLHLLKNIP